MFQSLACGLNNLLGVNSVANPTLIRGIFECKNAALFLGIRPYSPFVRLSCARGRRTPSSFEGRTSPQGCNTLIGARESVFPLGTQTISRGLQISWFPIRRRFLLVATTLKGRSVGEAMSSVSATPRRKCPTGSSSSTRSTIRNRPKNYRCVRKAAAPCVVSQGRSAYIPYRGHFLCN